MAEWKHEFWLRLATRAVLLALALLAGFAHSQQTMVGKVRNFKVSPEYYGPPHEMQMKSLLQGAEAEPQPGGQVLVRTARLQTFKEDGTREMLAETPECRYDSGRRAVTSSGPIRAETADGKFLIEGQGFNWQQTNSTLLISNQVHTFVHPDVFSPQASAPRSNASESGATGINIFSDSFEYGANAGLGVYRGNVRVAGTNLALSSGVLRFRLPMSDRQLQNITAEERVVADYEHIHATGEQAVYATETGRLQISGNPTWKAEAREGRGDELLIDRTNQFFLVTGHAFLKMPAQNMGGSGFLGGNSSLATNLPAATNQFVEITSDTYEVRTNFAVFRDQVRVNQRVGDRVGGTMSCGRMEARFGGTNELQSMTAENGVVIDQEDRQLAGARAFYTATNGILEMTGQPSWRAGAREGKGNLVKLDTQHDEMTVRENAWMRLPANELGLLDLRGATASVSTKTTSAGLEFADIWSEEYTFTPQTAVFRRHVRIKHPRMDWNCDQITVGFPKGGGRAERMVAERGVTFDLIDNRGQKVRGVGDQATYTYDRSPTLTNEIVRLLGNPARLETTNSLGTNAVFVLDLVRHKIAAPGKYAISGMGPGVDTNKLQLPKNKFFK